jgi:hypothetical protein
MHLPVLCVFVYLCFHGCIGFARVMVCGCARTHMCCARAHTCCARTQHMCCHRSFACTDVKFEFSDLINVSQMTFARTQTSGDTSREVEEECSRLRKQSIAIPSDFFRFEISALHILGLNLLWGGGGVGGEGCVHVSVGQKHVHDVCQS